MYSNSEFIRVVGISDFCVWLHYATIRSSSALLPQQITELNSRGELRLRTISKIIAEPINIPQIIKFHCYQKLIIKKEI